MRGRWIRTIGLPYHWSYVGRVTGDPANELIPFVADPNVLIQESKCLTGDIRPGRHGFGRRAATDGPPCASPSRAPSSPHRFGALGKALEIALMTRPQSARRRPSRGSRVRSAAARQARSLACSLLSGRGWRRAAGALGTAGALALRFAVLQAGRASSRDPRATHAQQRAGRGAAEVVTGKDRPGASLPALRGGGVGLGMEHTDRGPG